jgi:hypothetical protein
MKSRTEPSRRDPIVLNYFSSAAFRLLGATVCLFLRTRLETAFRATPSAPIEMRRSFNSWCLIPAERIPASRTKPPRKRTLR